jgi:putative DNA primase/helicase
VRNELTAVVNEAVSALLADPDAGIYVRAGLLVRIVCDAGEPHGGLKRPAGSPVIQPIPREALRELVDRAATWVKPNVRDGTEQPALPPHWVAPTIAARGTWPFPVITGVLSAPTIKASGELLDRAGYDEASGLLLRPSDGFPPLAPQPSASQVRQSVELLSEPFAEFPFVAPSDRATAFAAVLSLVARHAVPGCVPMFAIRATAPGTGKNLLGDAIVLIGTGRIAARMTLPREDAELRKVILAVALGGSPAVLLDNVDRPLGSASLAAALTAEEWEDRLLGVSARVRTPLRAVWIATGNGLTFRGDLGRRVLPIDLDARIEHPEDRITFRHADLLDWIREHRGKLVAAALTILRGYHVAGRPTHKCGPRKGSFEHWDDLIRGAVVWAEIGDPVAGTERIRREDDGDVAALRVALLAWSQAFGDLEKTAAQVVREAASLVESGRDTALRDALLGLLPHERLEARAIGYALRRLRGRICDGLRFEAGRDDRMGCRTWKVVREMPAMREMFPALGAAVAQDQGEEAGNISGITPISHDRDGSNGAESRDIGSTRPTVAVQPISTRKATDQPRLGNPGGNGHA